MLRAVKAHPGVFIGGMVTYAVVAHWLLPRYGGAVSGRMGGGNKSG
jgi:hypothetical protein